VIAINASSVNAFNLYLIDGYLGTNGSQHVIYYTYSGSNVNYLTIFMYGYSDLGYQNASTPCAVASDSGISILVYAYDTARIGPGAITQSPSLSNLQITPTADVQITSQSSLYNSFISPTDTYLNNLVFYPDGTGGIFATQSGVAAPATFVGSVVTAQASSISMSSGSSHTVASITLPYGDWDISGFVTFVGNGTTTTQSQQKISISSTNNTLSSFPNLIVDNVSIASGGSHTVAIPPQQILVSQAGGSLNFYLVAQATFAVSTLTANGYIYARCLR
jgi:hypothetical protein